MSQNPVVLYVEDDPLSCEIMQLLLGTAMGLEHVTIFTDSRDFMARVHNLQPQPDIVLLDIHVKPHDGFSMLEMLRQNGYAAKYVVALTASVMNEEVSKLQTAGFNGVIAKPIDQDTFPDILQRLLSGEEIWTIGE